MTSARHVSSTGLALIKAHESFEPEAYPDPGSPLGQVCAKRGWPMRKYRQLADWMLLDGNPWTIGYGHTNGVRPGDTCTEAQAEDWLQQDLSTAEFAVARNVTVPLSPSQFDALVSFTFNLGAGAFRSSTLLKKLNSGDYEGAAAEFPRWNKAQGRVLNGLIARRADEKDLFQSLA